MPDNFTFCRKQLFFEYHGQQLPHPAVRQPSPPPSSSVLSVVDFSLHPIQNHPLQSTRHFRILT